MNKSKKGFSIYIQSDLNEEEKTCALNFVKDFISKTILDSKMRYFGKPGGGYTSGLWRGRMGITLPQNHLVFRRISKNLRKFAVVRKNTLTIFNDKLLDKSHREYRDVFENFDDEKMNGCVCPRHSASLKVKFKQIPKLDLFAEIGEIKG